MADLFQLIADGCTTRQFYLVLQSGCNVNIRNDREETPLMTCITQVAEDEKRTTMLRLLLQRGSDVNAFNKRGQTAMIYACILDQADSIGVLLSKGNVDVSYRDFDGNTALMYACSLGNVMAVRTLFTYHTKAVIQLDFSVRNNEGATALEYALSSHHSQIVAMFAAIRYPSNTEQQDDSEYKPGDGTSTDKSVKDLYVDPEFLRVKKTPSNDKLVNKRQNVLGDNEQTIIEKNERAVSKGVPKITVSRASNEEVRMSDEFDVEGFGSLVQAMRECAVEMKQLHNHIENRETLNVNFHKAKRKRKYQSERHKSSFETTTVTLNTSNSVTKQQNVVNVTSSRHLLSVESPMGTKRGYRSDRSSKSSSSSKSLHRNSDISLRNSDEYNKSRLHSTHERQHIHSAEPVLSISNNRQIPPSVLCHVTPSNSGTKLTFNSDGGRSDESYVRHRSIASKRQKSKEHMQSFKNVSLADRCNIVLTPSQVTLQTNPQNKKESLESQSYSGYKTYHQKPSSSLFKDPWTMTNESLPQLPKFGQSKSPVHLPPLRETLRDAMKKSVQNTTTLKNIDKDLWKLLESSSSNSTMKK